MESNNKQFLKIMLDTYPTIPELRYKNNFTQQMINSFLDFKNDLLKNDSQVLFNKLPLLSENKDPLFYFKNAEFLNEMLDTYRFINNDNIFNINNEFHEDIIKGFIFSEIEGSLSIEGIHSSRKKIERISKDNYSTLKDENSIIIKNMINGYYYMIENEINERNLFELYNILSKNCLKDEDKLQNGNLYRHSMVTIVDSLQVIIDKGVESSNLEWMMKDLFKYINQPKKEFDVLIAPYLIHYYFIYLHPYYDYNGRTARALSFWYSVKYLPHINYLIISESINQLESKKNYYKAIESSRKSNNDITFFIRYLSTSSIRFTKVYFNLNIVTDSLLRKGIVFSLAEKTAIKNVLSLSIKQKGYFDWKKYMKHDQNNFKKQYYLRLLNSLCDYKVLDSKKSKGVKLFILNTSHHNLIIT